MPVCQLRNGLRMEGADRDGPVIVKAEWEHGSLGLDETSAMPCEDAPPVIVARTLLHNTDHFAEAYIEGREFNLALLERASGVEVLPISEILFGERLTPMIFGYHAKWTPDSAAYIGIWRFGLEKDEPELARTLKQFALDAWSLFGFAGMPRRFSRRSDRCSLHHRRKSKPVSTPDAEDVAAAAEAGLSYHELIGSIVESALRFAQARTYASQMLRIA